MNYEFSSSLISAANIDIFFSVGCKKIAISISFNFRSKYKTTAIRTFLTASMKFVPSSWL
jgi:hypothetical protein